MSDSLWSYGLQYTRLPFPSLSPWVCSNSCPLSQSYYLNISSSAVPFSFCIQSFPASESFPMSWLFTSDSQSIGASTSASVLPMNIQGWFLLGLTGLISCCPRDSQESSPAPTIWRHQFFSTQLSLWSSSHIHTWLLEKIIALTIRTFVGKVRSLLFIAFLSRSKHLLISWLQSLSAVGRNQNGSWDRKWYGWMDTLVVSHIWIKALETRRKLCQDLREQHSRQRKEEIQKVEMSMVICRTQRRPRRLEDSREG